MIARLSRIRALNQQSFESYGEDASHAMQALKMAIELGDQASIAESKFIIGHCLVVRGRTRDASTWLHEARDLFDAMPNDPVLRQWQSPLQVALALVCDDLCDFEGARRHSEQALQIALADGQGAAQQRALVYLGYAHYKLGHSEEALEHMMESLRHPSRSPTQVYMAHDFIADLLEQQGLWAVVLKQRLKALDHLAAAENFRTARVRCGIARCLLNMDRLDEAWSMLLLADAAVAHYEEPVRVTGKICEAKSLYHLRKGNFGQAWHFHALFTAHVQSCGSTQYADDALLLKAEIELAEGQLDAGQLDTCRATCSLLQLRPMSFHRRLALDVIREKLSGACGDWAQAYRLHLSTEALQRVDLGMAFERREEIHRMELESLRNKAAIEKTAQLERMGEERDDLMQLVVHDMANYLQVTRNSIEVVSRIVGADAPKLSVSKESLVARSLSSLDMIEEVLGQLRLLWQVESGPLGAPELEALPLVPVINEVLANYRMTAAKKNQTLVLEAGDVDVVCRVNAQHLNQILSNLVSNAIKFSPSGARTRILVAPNLSGTLVRIHVEDQGLGMSPEDVGLAFQRFRRLSARPTGGEPSNGLGLYLVKRMAEPMGGELSVRSAGKNHGTVFTLQLPLVDASGLRPH